MQEAFVPTSTLPANLLKGGRGSGQVISVRVPVKPYRE